MQDFEWWTGKGRREAKNKRRENKIIFIIIYEVGIKGSLQTVNHNIDTKQIPGRGEDDHTARHSPFVGVLAILAKSE